MEKVKGFGGFFFRANDPQALAAWYNKHLGIAPVPTGPQEVPWITESGPVVFSPFPDDTGYFAADRAFMLNFRVGDLDAMERQLRAAGIAVGEQSEMEGIGRFVRIHDPEGNAIELWQPAG